MKFYVQYFPITKSFGYIANVDNISLDSFCEHVRVSDEFCQSIVMSVFCGFNLLKILLKSCFFEKRLPIFKQRGIM
jgi:hypothetical protein